MAIAEFSVVPLGTGHTSLSQYVVECQQQVRDSGLKYQLTPMGTIVEGEMPDILRLLAQVHEAPFNCGAQRVYTSVKIDDRRDIQASMAQKLQSVAQRMPAAEESGNK